MTDAGLQAIADAITLLAWMVLIAAGIKAFFNK